MNTSTRKRYPVILLAVAVLMQLAPFFQSFSLRLRPDDFGPLIYPAALAGYDWTEYVSSTNNYYGFGYYWIFAPLFRWICSPRILLLAMVAVNSLLIVCSALLIYHLLTRYCGMEEGWLCAAIALAATMYHGKLPQTGEFWVRTDNETPFYVICWLLIWVMLASIRTGSSAGRNLAAHTAGSGAARNLAEHTAGRSVERKPSGYSLACSKGSRESGTTAYRTWLLQGAAAALLLCWAMTVHERALSLLLGAVVVELVLYLLKRKWVFAPVTFFPVLVIGFVATRLLRNVIIRHFWAGGWPGKNTSALASVNLWFLESLTALKTFAIVLFGNLHALLIGGLGIPAIAMVVVVGWLIHSLVMRINAGRSGHTAAAGQEKREQEKQGQENREHEKQGKENRERSGMTPEEEWISPEILVMLLAGICTAIIIFGIAVRWGGTLVEGIRADEVVYAYKGICYNRYFFLFIGPLVWGSLVFLSRRTGFSRKAVLAVWAVLLILEGIFFGFVFPYCKKGGETYLKRTLGPYFKVTPGGGTGQALVISVALMLLVMLILTCSIFLRQGGRAVLAGAFCILGIFALGRLQQVSRSGFSFRFRSGEDTCVVLNAVKDADALPENVYIPKSKQSHMLQYLNRDISFHAGMPEDDALAQENLLITTKEKKKLGEDYQGWKIGSYWYYTNDPAAADVLENCRQ